MKHAIIKVTKRQAVGDADRELSRKPPTPLRSTVTETVTEWIELNRSNRLDEDRASRKTIAAWSIEPTFNITS